MPAQSGRQPDERTSLLPNTPRPPSSRNANANASAPGDDDGEGPPARNLILTLSGPYILAFLFALDSTLVATLATPISNEFSSLALLTWLASSFFIANAISQPLAGRLTDIYGRRSGILVAASLFCLGNILCAEARSSSLVVAGRAIAGLGGGAIGPIATACVGDLLPLRRRGLWQGSLNVWFGIGSSLGAPVGGLMNDALNWRAAFWIQVPLTILAITLVCLFFRLPSTDRSEDKGGKSVFALVDYQGAFVLTLLLMALLLSLGAGGKVFSWTSPVIVGGIVTSLLLLPIFVWVELRQEYAIMPPKLFKNPTVIAASLTNFFITLSRFGLFFYGPVFFLAQGYSTTQAGLRFIPESVATMFTSIGTGYIMRLTGRYYILNLSLALIYVAAFAAITATFAPQLPGWVPFVCFFFVGVGYSGMLTTTLLAYNAAVTQAEQAVVTSTSYVFRSTGSAISVTIASAVFQDVLSKSLVEHFGSDENGRDMVARAQKSVKSMRGLPFKPRELAIQSYMQALRHVWLTLLVCASLAFISGLFKREHRLHQRIDRADTEE